MLKFSSSLSATLLAIADRVSYGNAIASALGTPLRISFKRDADSSAADPWATGTEFLNAALSSLTVDNDTGDLTLGMLSNLTTKLAANLSTGASVWRIYNGSVYVQGSLGLTGSGKDFVVSASPTGNGAVGIKAGTKIKPPSSLPIFGVDVPYSVTLEDWSTGSAVVVSTIIFDTTAAPLVFEDSEIAAEIKTVSIKQCSQSLVLGNFEFGAQRFTLDSSLNADDASKPFYQVAIACKPYGTWAKYPFTGTGAGAYNAATDSTIPPPFKIRIKNSSGTTLKLHEMRDGAAINSSVNNSTWTAAAWRPWFNVKMMLPWTSANIKKSSKATKFYPGVTADSLRPSQGKKGASTLEVYPTITGNTDAFNSGSHWFATPRWPMQKGENPSANDPIQNDPYLYDIENYSPSEGRAARICGWDYEPGSVSMHNWLTGPGGPRFDRAVIPTSIAMAISDPTGSRLKDGTSYTTMLDAWGKAYFNHAHHDFTNVKTFASIPDALIEAGAVSYDKAYYGDSALDADHSVRLYTAPASNSMAAYDKDGKPHYNGWAPDDLHAYPQPGLMTLLFNSPMHLISAKLRHNANIMARLANAPPNATAVGYYMQRNMAWRWRDYIAMWKLGTTNSIGRSKATIESMFQTELETIYTQIVVPATTPANAGYSSPMSQALRNLGVSCRAEAPDNISGLKFWRMTTKSHVFYMSQVLQMFLQTGLWTVMHAKNAACAAAMDYTIRCLDLYSIDWILDTGGKMELYPLDGESQPISAGVATGNPDPNICTSWANWAVSWPLSGSEDWLHNPDGSYRLGGRPEQDITQHLRAQYAFMRRDNPGFGIANARLTAACAAYQAYYDNIAARAAAQPTPALQRDNDWTYRLPSLGILKVPTA